MLEFLTFIMFALLLIAAFAVGCLIGAYAFAAYMKRRLEEAGIEFTPDQGKPLPGDEWKNRNKKKAPKESDEDEWLRKQLGD